MKRNTKQKFFLQKKKNTKSKIDIQTFFGVGSSSESMLLSDSTLSTALSSFSELSSGSKIKNAFENYH